MRQVTPPGRWVWVLAGLLTAAVLLIPGTRLIDSVWASWPTPPPAGVTNVTVHATPTAAP